MPINIKINDPTFFHQEFISLTWDESNLCLSHAHLSIGTVADPKNFAFGWGVITKILKFDRIFS